MLVKNIRFKRKEAFTPKYVNDLQRSPTRPQQVDTTDQHIIWGKNDRFPLELASLIENSPSGISCISTISDFIEGDKFANEALSDVVINSSGDTLGEFNSMLADQLSIYWSVAICVKYNAEGRKVGLYPVQIENCRFKKPGKDGKITHILYNPFFGTDEFRPSETEVYPVFNDDLKVVLAEQNQFGKKYKGQIFFWSKTTALSRFYSKPAYYSARKWLDVDWRISEYHGENLESGLLQPVIFKMKGDPNQKSTNPKYAGLDEDKKPTNGQEFDENMSDNFTGTERVGNIMVLWGQSNDEMPELEAFPVNANGDWLNNLAKETNRQITIGTKVPAILANISEGATLGGDGNVIRAAVKLMQQRTVKWRNLLERIYKRLFKDFALTDVPTDDFTIVPYNPFPEIEVVDKQIWDSLNVETKNNWIRKNTTIEIIEPKQIQPVAPVSTFANISYESFPDAAKKNVSRALKFMEDTKSSCGSKAGLAISMAIMEGKPITYKTIKRINRFLEKNLQFKDKLFSESCDSLLFAAWGGADMLKWTQQKIEEIG